MSELYYVCPECGFKQKSQAVKRIECHRCGRSYQRRKAKTERKTPDEGHDYALYTRSE